jgi:hypothetical protein
MIIIWIKAELINCAAMIIINSMIVYSYDTDKRGSQDIVIQKGLKLSDRLARPILIPIAGHSLERAGVGRRFIPILGITLILASLHQIIDHLRSKANRLIKQDLKLLVLLSHHPFHMQQGFKLILFVEVDPDSQSPALGHDIDWKVDVASKEDLLCAD